MPTPMVRKAEKQRERIPSFQSVVTNSERATTLSVEIKVACALLSTIPDVVNSFPLSKGASIVSELEQAFDFLTRDALTIMAVTGEFSSHFDKIPEAERIAILSERMLAIFEVFNSVVEEANSVGTIAIRQLHSLTTGNPQINE